MPLHRVRVRPPNSLIFLMDDRVGVVPDDTGAATITATSSCVTVWTLSEMDGETEVLMSGPEDFEPTSDLKQAWSGRVLTAGALEISTSHADLLLAMDLPSDRSPAVSIWTNDHTAPDVVWIVVDQTWAADPPSARRGLSRGLVARTRRVLRGPRR